MRLVGWLCKGQHSPSVPRPPNCRCPNRENGRLMVTMSGVTWRITMVAEGLVGKSCGIFAAFLFLFSLVVVFGFESCAPWRWMSQLMFLEGKYLMH